MKKYFFGLAAIGFALVFSSFRLFAPLNFRFVPANESEAAFETAANWVASGTTHFTCSGGNDVCIIEIDDSELAPYTGTNTEKLAKYMQAQTLGQDYPSAVAAANDLAIVEKP